MEKKNNFVGSAVFFAVAGIIIKILGAVYKIVLGNESFLGTIGVSYVAVTYPYYNVLLAIATAGIPVAIAKMVSTHNARGELQEKEDLFRLVRKLMAITGAVLALILYLASPAICRATGFDDAVYTMRTIAIAILVVPYMATYRGYFQGHGDLKPFGISQIIEQLCRVALGLLFATLLYPYGIEYAAAGAVLGTGLGAVFSAVFLWAYARVFKKKRSYSEGRNIGLREGMPIIKRVLYYAIPISIGASVMPLIEMVDGFIIKTGLLRLGYVDDMATTFYSYHAFYSESVINFPIILFVALQLSVLPAVSSLLAVGDREKMSKTIKIALKLTVMVSVAASVGLFVLAKPVLMFLWPGLSEMHDKTELILRIMCVALFFVSIYQSTSGVMQGMGLHIRNAVHLLIGAIIKAVFSYVLIAMPSVNILSASISTTIAFFVAASLNLISLKRRAGLDLNVFKLAFKPLISALIMGVVVHFSYAFAIVRFSNAISTLLSVGIGAALYFVLVLALRFLERDDLEFLPASRFFSRFVK